MSDVLTEQGNAAIVQVAKRVKQDKDFYTLSNGARAVIKPVAPSLIDAVTSKIKVPNPPMFFNEGKGRDEPNYVDPKYVQDVADAEAERGRAAIDAIIVFGVELVDEVVNDGWYDKLLYLKVIDSRKWDELDDFERKLLYLKYVAVGGDDIGKIANLSGVRQEDVKAAEDSFRS